MLILITLLVLGLILLSIAKFDLHPFLALLGGAVIFGLIVGMPTELILQSIQEGFGNVIGNIGILILFGVIIGTILEKTGGGFVIAQKILKWVGEKSVTLTMFLSGWLLSIPIFADSTFIMMNPIAKSVSKKSGISYAVTVMAVALGATASHSLVPPTPGPIATAGILNADLGLIIFYGIIISLLTLIPSYIFVNKFVSKIPLEPIISESNSSEKENYQPSAAKSFAPVIIPLILIVLASFAKYPSNPLGEGSHIPILIFIGHPIIALFIGILLSLFLPKKFDKKIISSTGWMGESLLQAAPVIFITGAGGVFGKMLQNSGIGTWIGDELSTMGLGLFLPYLIAFSLKTSQGSSTVAMITSATIVQPLLGPLGLDSEIMRVFTTLAIGAGAMAISHANDSFFWAVTQLSGMDIKKGNLTQSLGTLVLSFSAIIILLIITQIVL